MTAPATTDLSGDYALDVTHTRLGFTARHAMVTKVRGSFEQFEGAAHLDFEDPTKSTATVTFQIASINTGQPQRDDHLRTNDFFDAPTFPVGTFVSTSVVKKSDEEFEMTGDLTLKDTTKPVTITWEHTGTARDPFGNFRAGFEGRATISRKDWGIEYNAVLETGGVLISDKINLEFDVSAVKNA
ncbi:MAG: polyisoprenoid-binding protein [Frankiales bacterium]|jgi:polyisoprenoid-binding protein YceI|nr:polyisoprenoid-binding protein [Frankiales bacterium]MCW2586030.1 polyisoprenoid-binding protein [Frankiales bacterium]